MRLKRMVSQHFRKIAISLLSSELTGRNQSRLKSAGTNVLPGCVIVFDRNACWDPVGSSFYVYRGAYHLTENFENSGWKVNGKVTFRKFQPKIEEYVLR